MGKQTNKRANKQVQIQAPVVVMVLVVVVGALASGRLVAKLAIASTWLPLVAAAAASATLLRMLLMLSMLRHPFIHPIGDGGGGGVDAASGWPAGRRVADRRELASTSRPKLRHSTQSWPRYWPME